MPSVSQAQQEAAGADLERVREGKQPINFKGASIGVLREFAKTKRKGLPKHKGKSHAQRLAAARHGGH